VKKIAFSKEERAAIVEKVRRYFTEELDQEIGVLPAEMLLQFLSDEIGAFYYNRGLADAHQVFADKLDEIGDAIYGLEQREARVR
jgi:uncharacterized protein (DUF2164 family)